MASASMTCSGRAATTSCVLRGAKSADLPMRGALDIRAGHQDREGTRSHDPALAPLGRLRGGARSLASAVARVTPSSPAVSGGFIPRSAISAIWSLMFSLSSYEVGAAGAAPIELTED
jgi:hypothetical protein